MVNTALHFWLAVRCLLPVLLSLAALVLVAFVLDTKLTERKW